jgi:hypothetical protein
LVLTNVVLYILRSFPSAGFQVSIMGALPSSNWLCSVLSPVLGAERLVLVGAELAVWVPPNFWFVLILLLNGPVALDFFLRLHHDDSTTFHQLQTEVSCSLAVENAHLQGPEHLH